MSEGENLIHPTEKDFLIQDGASCPRTPPWDPRVSKLTGLSFIPFIVLAIYILASTNIFQLVFWIILMGVFFYPLRYLVCARCPYYGQVCSSNMGVLVTKMFKKQNGKSMKLGLWLDVVIFLLLFLIPLPQSWKVGGILLMLVWIAVCFLVFATLTRLGCSACPFTFCPIGRAGRAFWSKLGKPV